MFKTIFFFFFFFFFNKMALTLFCACRFLQGGLFSKLVGSLRRTRHNTARENIELGNVERRRDRAYTSDARLNMAR